MQWRLSFISGERRGRLCTPRWERGGRLGGMIQTSICLPKLTKAQEDLLVWLATEHHGETLVGKKQITSWKTLCDKRLVDGASVVYSQWSNCEFEALPEGSLVHVILTLDGEAVARDLIRCRDVR